MSKTKIPSWIVIVLLLPLILSLIAYWLNFSSNGLSDSNADWAAFSTYWAAFITLVNTIVISILTYRLYEYNKNRDKQLAKVESENKRREDIMERPVIVFRKFTGGLYYTLSNVGKGAAINITIKTAHKKYSSLQPETIEKSWNYCCEAYSLREGENEEMKWTSNCYAISAIYYDIYGHRYYSYMDADKLRTFSDADLDLGKYIDEYSKLDLHDCEYLAFSWLNIHNGLPRTESK